MIRNDLPLVDIHRHLDGNIRPSTIWQLAQQQNIALPAASFEEFLPFVQVQSIEPDLLAFLQKLDWGVSVLTSLDICKQIAFENVEDAFKAGLNYVELRFSPYYMGFNHKLSPADVTEAVIDGIKSATKQFDIKVNLIGILSRTNGVETCQYELDGLLNFKESLVAIDLAGDEIHFPADLFINHFKQVRNAGLDVTIHAGEALGPESVWQAINLLGATRIGHGVNSYKDLTLIDFMVKHNICIESCLTSNLQTGTVTNLEKHPIKQFLDAGIKVSLNTDDPAIEGIEIKHEYDIAKRIVGLTDNQLSTIQLNGIKAAFLSESEKNALLTKFKHNPKDLK